MPNTVQKKNKAGVRIAVIMLIVVIIAVTSAVLYLKVYLPSRGADKYCDAILQGDNKTLQKLLDKKTAGVDNLCGSWWSNDRYTPLAYACRVGNFDAVKMLHEHGASLDIIDKETRSPLIEVLEYYDVGDYAIVKYLLDNGVSPIGNDTVYCPILWAANMTPRTSYVSKTDGIRYFYGDNYDATVASSIYSIYMLLFQYSEINMDSMTSIRDNNGRTALMLATNAGNFVFVSSYLISFSSPENINFTDRNNRTALFYVTEKLDQFSELAKILITAGINVQCKDISGKTAAEYAQERGDIKLSAIITSWKQQ